MFDKFTDWRPPLATSPRWQTRQISLGFSVPDPSQYWQALASALQCHSFPPVFDIVSGHERWRYDCGTLHIVDDVDAGMVTSILLVIFKEESQYPPTVDSAVRIGAPIFLTAFRQIDQDVIQITFDIGVLSTSQASWLLLHIERAIPTPKGSQPTSRAAFVVEDLLFRGEEPRSTCRYERPNNHIFPPNGELVHTCFYERVKAIPLAPAVIFFDQPQAGTEPVIINYLELYLCALRFIHKLELLGIHHGDSVALGRLHPHLATIVTVALSMSGVASIPAEALNNIPRNSYHYIPCAIITENPFPAMGLPVIDPPHCGSYNDNGLYTEDRLWPQLPSISKEEPFLADTKLGTFISNANFLDALLENYDSLSLCQKRVLYADVKVNERMLEIIWQTLLHGGTICSPLDDVEGKSIVPLAQPFPQTHFCVDEKTLRRVIANITPVTTKCVNLPTIMLPSEPIPATKDLLNRHGLSYVVLQKINRHSKTMTSVIKDPIRILLPCKNSDLTPDEVLRNLETGVNLNTFDTGTSVKLICGDKVVKYGGLVRAAEAYNMEYVRKRTRINIPAVHLAFYHAGRTYIVMDYVRGHTLHDRWASASKIQRLAWASQLAEIISQLRALPSMNCTRPGPLNPSMEERCEGRWFTTFGAGPFRSHHDLAMWLNRKLSIARRGGDETSTYSVFESTCRLVFTHQDLAARNLILDDDGRLWAIDWELAGWYPEYMEYACIASDTGAPKFPVPQCWKETVLSYLQAYKREYEMLQSLRWVLDVMPFS